MIFLPWLPSRLFRMRLLDKKYAGTLDRVIAFKRLNFPFTEPFDDWNYPPEKRSRHASKFIPCGDRRIGFNLFIVEQFSAGRE
jgi:hypothetical protein